MVLLLFHFQQLLTLPQNTNMTRWSFVSKVVVQKIELKRNQVNITGMLFMNHFFFWPRMEKAKVALFYFIHCNSFFERRKLECEVYTLLFSLYNPQQKVATYSSRKWIEAKHRNKSLKSLLIITRHLSLRANYFNDMKSTPTLAMMSPCMWYARYSRHWSAAFLWEKGISFSWFIFNWGNYCRSSDIVLVIIPFYTYHNWPTNPSLGKDQFSL